MPGSTLNFPAGGPFTIATWINNPTLQTCKAIMGKIYTKTCGTWSGSYGFIFNGGTAGQVRGNDITGTAPQRCQYTFTANTWTHLAWIRSSVGNTLANTNMYINGVLLTAAATDGAASIRTDSLPFCIGKDADSGTGASSFWAGQVGETQISNIVRDSNWVRLSYKNQLSATGLTTFGAVTTITPPAPAAPTLATPANAATGTAIAPTLTWGTVASAVTYRVQVSTISTFATTVADDSTLAVGTKAITGLANSTTYYWRANAKNAGGSGVWSSIFSFTTASASTNYSAWQAYRTVTITPRATDAAAAVTNFPVLVRLTSGNAAWTNCNSNGFDVRFTSADGTVDYPFQRAYWNYSTTSGYAEFWVLVPTIAAGPAVTSLRMYWGNAAATDVSSGSSVFKTTNNYVAVWHMNAASGANELDATGSGHDAVQNGTPTTEVGPSGNIVKGFDGSTQYYKVNNSSNAGSTLNFPIGGPFTIATWFNKSYPASR